MYIIIYFSYKIKATFYEPHEYSNKSNISLSNILFVFV